MEEDDAPIPLKKYKKIPVFIVEDHNDVLPFIYRCIGSKHLPVYNNTIIHLDSHPDLLVSRDLTAETAAKKLDLFDALSIENWILPAAFAGHLTRVVWIKPPWSNQMKEGTRHFAIGRNAEGKIRVDSLESYFLADGLYCPADRLDNKKDVLLSVHTLGIYEEDENEEIEESQSYAKVVEGIMEGLKTLEEYILDIDLDFFSTMNPFKNLYDKSDLYERLKDLYSFSLPEVPTESGLVEAAARREQQLARLAALFQHLEEQRTLGDWPGERDHLYREVCELVRSVRRHYSDREVDWLLVHDAGCTRDDTDLPHHVSGLAAIAASARGPFRQLLGALPRAPTAVTVARSSKDDYCPPEQVEEIQAMVLQELQRVFNTDGPILHYLINEDD